MSILRELKMLCFTLPIFIGTFTGMFFSEGSTASTAAPIINVNPGSGLFDEAHGDGMVGWYFELLEPFSVTQVGWYDEGADGLSRPFQIGLWARFGSSSLIGDPINGLIIPAGTNTSLSGAWRVVDLTVPLTLQPGYYSIGGWDTSVTTDVIKYLGAGPPPQALAPPGSPLIIEEFFYAWPSPFPVKFGPPTDAYAYWGLELGPMLFGIPAPGPGLNIRRLDRGVVLTWPTGTLEQSDGLTGPYTAVTNGVSPYFIASLSLQKFYRLSP